jgi:hypothetical protein
VTLCAAPALFVVHAPSAASKRVANEASEVFSSPVPKALLDRLEALSPKPRLRRELTSCEQEMWVKAILRMAAHGSTDPDVQKIAALVATVNARKALLDRPIDELA